VKDITKILAQRHLGPPECWCEDCKEVYAYEAILLEGKLTPQVQWQLSLWGSVNDD